MIDSCGTVHYVLLYLVLCIRVKCYLKGKYKLITDLIFTYSLSMRQRPIYSSEATKFYKVSFVYLKIIII